MHSGDWLNALPIANCGLHLDDATPPFYCRRRSRLNLSMLLLLIIGGVEVNPGPSPSTNLTFGMLNVRSVVNKAPLLHSLITDHDLSILALTETWVKTDDPRRSKNGPAPPGYRITHVHRDNPDLTRGGGLAVIHRDTINVQPRKHKLTQIHHLNFNSSILLFNPATLSWPTSTAPHPPANRCFSRSLAHSLLLWE